MKLNNEIWSNAQRHIWLADLRISESLILLARLFKLKAPHLNKLQAILAFSVEIINISIHVCHICQYIFIYFQHRAERPSWVIEMSRELCPGGRGRGLWEDFIQTGPPLPLPLHTVAALSADVCRHRTPSKCQTGQIHCKSMSKITELRGFFSFRSSNHLERDLTFNSRTTKGKETSS